MLHLYTAQYAGPYVTVGMMRTGEVTVCLTYLHFEHFGHMLLYVGTLGPGRDRLVVHFDKRILVDIVKTEKYIIYTVLCQKSFTLLIRDFPH